MKIQIQFLEKTVNLTEDNIKDLLCFVKIGR